MAKRREPGSPAAPRADLRGPVRKARRPALGSAASWGYQLQGLDIARAAGSPFDVLVVDYALDGTADTALGPRDVMRLRRRPDGRRRIVLAYLSIGEAESYRFYWDSRWTRERPAWLLSENPDWSENFAVRFWDPGWQRLIFGAPRSYLERIVAAGFDGVYLDKCDVFDDIASRERNSARLRPDLEGDMVDLVVRLARHARSLAPGFLVVMQNAETLLEHEELREAIDGAAKEELLFGLSGPERRNPRDEVLHARRALDRLRRAGKTVLLVEYLDDPGKAAEAVDYAATAGYVLYVAPKDRALDRLNLAGPVA